MTQLEIWAPPLLIWAVNLIKSKYLDAEIGYDVGTGHLSSVLICPCFNRSPFRSTKNVGSSLEVKYPSDSMFCHSGLPATSVEISTVLTEMWKWDWREGPLSKKMFQGKNYPKVKWMGAKNPATLVNLWSCWIHCNVLWRNLWLTLLEVGVLADRQWNSKEKIKGLTISCAKFLLDFSCRSKDPLNREELIPLEISSAQHWPFM